MVVIDRQPEKVTDPFPVAIRIELAHFEQWLDPIGEVHSARRVRSEVARRLSLDFLNVLGPTRPLIEGGRVSPCLFNWQLYRKLSAKGRDHSCLPGYLP